MRKFSDLPRMPRAGDLVEVGTDIERSTWSWGNVPNDTFPIRVCFRVVRFNEGDIIVEDYKNTFEGNSSLRNENGKMIYTFTEYDYSHYTGMKIILIDKVKCKDCLIF